MDAAPILEARGITKLFGSITANKEVNFDLKKGEIHAVLGENGAGKSTLMNMISGIYQPDEGGIFIDGQPIVFKTPREALNAGVGMVHQHFMLIPVFSVLENFLLCEEMDLSYQGMCLNRDKVEQRIDQLSSQLGWKVDPNAIIESLSVSVQQRVEILKALYRHVRILILDEPTAVLTPQEVVELFRVMKTLSNQGVSIVFITHKLKEVLEISDRITVMRRGQVIETTLPGQIHVNQLAEMMVGRDVNFVVEKRPISPGPVILDVRHLTVKERRGANIVHDISFQVRSGEILGIAGVQGNGQAELASALSGLQAVSSGTVIFDGKTMPFLNPRALIKAGMAHIPEDRIQYGLVLPYTIADNQVLCSYFQYPFARYMLRKYRKVMENGEKLMALFDIRAPSPLTLVGTLSGGNQQKVILSRELSRDIRFLIANQPTRGLDVGSIEYIHQQIIKLRDRGIGVLLISTELDEIMALSDRIAVMYKGQFITIVEASQTSREQVGLWMTGNRI